VAARTRNAERYRLWDKLGFLTFTEGEATDFDQVERDILALNDRHPFRLALRRPRLRHPPALPAVQHHGLPVKGIPQGPVTLNEPMVKLEA
jgi:phage terminase large subunit-like protein